MLFRSGTSSFNSPSFIEFLEICNRQHIIIEGEGPAHPLRGDQLLNLQWFFNASQLVNLAKGENFTYIGIPSDINTIGQISADIQFQMSSQSEHKDAVWSFLRTALNPENSANIHHHFSTTKAVFDAQLQSMLNDSSSLTQKDIDKFTDFVNRIELVKHSEDINLRGIILGIADTYFDGEITAEEAAELIEEAANLYLSEKNS